ncbi:TonB-dependent receptor [Tropicimonas sp.]|uniref:TonB-dependent receptor n=1 Tax=Tropicimonas sp. TaxID=2067044 RepID=UPI003A8BA9B1
MKTDMRPNLRDTHSALLLSTAMALAGIGPATAQEDPAATDLGVITILPTGLATSAFESQSSVSLVESDEIEKEIPRSVADLLTNVPGVTVDDGGTGIERIRIRGESSRRVAISIDGQKLTDHSTYGQPILVDPAAIERIEVVRGATSVVSGSRAIGGAVNIITKRGSDAPIEGQASATYYSASDGFRGSASLAGGYNAFDWRLTYAKTSYGNRMTPDGELDPSSSDSENLTAHLGYTLGNHYFALKGQAYDISSETYTGDPDFTIDLPKRDLRKGGLYYEGTDLTPWMSRLSANVYYQTIDREFENDVTVAIPMGPFSANMNVLSTSDDEQITSGFNLQTELSFVDGQRTAVGLEYENDFIDTDKTSTVTFASPFGPPTVTDELREDDARIRTTSAYLQHEMDFTPVLTGTLGARYYHVEAELEKSRTNGVNNGGESNSDDRWLGSAGLVWTPRDDLMFRANVSQGYIYPTLSQLFLSTTAGGGTTLGNAGLDPETATTYEIGTRYDAGGTVLDAVLFYTEAEDYIAAITIDDVNDIAQYQNVDTATSWGLELYAEHDIGGTGIVPYVSGAFMKRRFEYANGYETFDSGTPNLSGRIGIRKDWRANWGEGSLDLYVRGESRAVQRSDDGDVATAASGYGTLNFRTDTTFDNGLSLVAEITNIGDKSYDPIDQLPGAERSFNVSASYRF